MSLKKFFIILFAISIATALFIKLYPEINTLIYGKPSSNTTKSLDKNAPIHQKTISHSISIEPQFSTNDDFILIASLITSLLSFLGFILSSYYSLKSHSREEELFDLKREKENLEMEKIRAEIQALRKKNNV